MKKLFAVLLALAMLMTAVAFAEDAPEVTGTWYLNELVMEGGSLSPADFGMEMSMTLNGDGTATSATKQGDAVEEGTGSWVLDGETLTITIDGSEQAFSIGAGTLTAEMDGMTMVFGQEQVAGEAYAPAAAVAAEAAEDFAGSWTAVKVGYDGTYMDWSIMGEALGEPMTATIDGTTLTLNGFMFSGEALEMAFADGALNYSANEPDSEMIAGIAAQLLEDGSLMLTLSMGSDAVFILEKDA